MSSYADRLPVYLSENPVWVALAQAMDTVLGKVLRVPTQQLMSVRDVNNYHPSALATKTGVAMLDSSDASWEGEQWNPTSTRISLATMVGMNFYNLAALSDKTIYDQFIKYAVQFYPEQGTPSWSDYLGFATDTLIEITQLWAQTDSTGTQYVNMVPVGDPSIGTPVWAGGTWFPTSHYDVTVLSNFGTTDIQQLTELLQFVAPINVVFRNIQSQYSSNVTNLYFGLAATIEVEWFAGELVTNISTSTSTGTGGTAPGGGTTSPTTAFETAALFSNRNMVAMASMLGSGTPTTWNTTQLNMYDGSTMTLKVPFKTWIPAYKTRAVPPSTTGKTYYVSTNTGSDTNNGTSSSTPFKTIAAAINVVAGGDTVLIMGGYYREGIALQGGQSGTSTAPITFGSYGDSEVILDGSAAVTSWTNVSGSVYQATLTFVPIAVAIDGLPLYTYGSTTAASVTSGSKLWYYNSTTKVLTVDFGAANPSTAQITIPDNSGSQYHVYWYGSAYVVFDGLTIRGSAGAGVWGYGTNITVQYCNIELNAKHAINFTQLNSTDSGCQALCNRAANNVLLNWPRGNGGFAQSGGGWAGGIAFSGMINGYATGNISHNNGGEGIISYGTGGNVIFERNISMDNWSVNMYFDNQIGDIARYNILMNHDFDVNTAYYPPSSTNWTTGDPYKFSSGLMLADEYSSSSNGSANLANSKVYNNLIIGCRLGIRDYSEGTPTISEHGLKNTLVANNTIIMPSATEAALIANNSYLAGIFIQDNGTQNVNSFIVNNVVLSFGSGISPVLRFIGDETTLTGITLEDNVYYNPNDTQVFWYGANTNTTTNLAGWQAHISNDAGSLQSDPLLVNDTGFQVSGTTPYDFTNAFLQGTSPALTTGVSESTTFTDDLVGSSRLTPFGAGAFLTTPVTGRQLYVTAAIHGSSDVVA